VECPCLHGYCFSQNYLEVVRNARSNLSESIYNWLQSVSHYHFCYLLNSQIAFPFWFTLLHIQCPGLGHSLQMLEFWEKNLSVLQHLYRQIGLSCTQALGRTLLPGCARTCWFCNYVDVHQHSENYLQQVCYSKEWQCIREGGKLLKGFTCYSSIFWQTLCLTSPFPSQQQQPVCNDSCQTRTSE
jgi:hypothetical protein